MSSCLTCNGCTPEQQLTEYEFFKQRYALQKEFSYNFEEHSLPTSVMLSVTNNCNLSCPYCFVQQSPINMTYEIAEQTILWLKTIYVKKGIDLSIQKMSINFFGGEPLLLFDQIIKPLVENYNHEVDFGITTNGVLLNEDVVDFFYQYNITPLLSFDGIPVVQNSQRPGKNFNSFDKVLNNIPYLLLRLPQTVMRATLTKESMPYVYDTYLMAKELGFRKLVFCPNAFENWTETEETLLSQEFNKIGLDIYKSLQNINTYPVISVDPIVKGVSIINNAINGKTGFNNNILRCGLGTTTCAITPTGDIVPCQEKTSNPTTIIGNVWDGIDQNKHKQFLINYFEKVNSLNCDKHCNPKAKIMCMSNTCPSRLEDLKYTISTAECVFHKAASKVSSRLHYLCSESFNPYIRDYFSESEVIVCSNP